jgi:transposase
VQFRVDFPSWRGTLDYRRRRLVDAMMQGHSTSELATRFRVSAGRVAQMRREFHDGYAAFCG